MPKSHYVDLSLQAKNWVIPRVDFSSYGLAYNLAVSSSGYAPTRPVDRNENKEYQNNNDDLQKVIEQI